MAHAVGGFLLTVARQWITNIYIIIIIQYTHHHNHYLSTCSNLLYNNNIITTLTIEFVLYKLLKT